MSPTVLHQVAIDPIATILHGRALELYYLIHHPNEPAIKAIEEVLKKATPEERRDIGAKAKLMADLGEAVLKVLPKEKVIAK